MCTGVSLPLLFVLIGSPDAVAAPSGPDAAHEESGDEAFGDRLETGRLTIRTLTQVRYGSTFARAGGTDERATAQAGDGWRLNRMFWRFIAAPTKRVQARFLVDLAELSRGNGRRTLKLAYAEGRPWKWLELTAGLFKRRFSLLELLPIADFELADVGPTDDLIKDLGYAGRDIGGMLRLMPLEKRRYLSVWVGAFAGDGQEGYDASPAKLVTARVESKPVPFLRIGADVAWRPTRTLAHERFPGYELETVTLDRGKAASADLSVSLAGLDLRLEGMLGQRTDARWRGPATHFASTWMAATYRLQAGPLALIPALRAEWLDADSARRPGGRAHLSGALNVDLDNVRLLIDVSRYAVQRDTQALRTRPWPQPVPGPDREVRPLDVDRWTIVLQLQVKI